MQEFLGHLTFIERYLSSPARPMITVADVALSSNETFQWIFSGLNVNLSQCCLDSICITTKSDSQSNDMEHLVENPKITIFNSSFGSLRSNPQTEAQITDCYIDAQFKPRPTLITANNSDVSIQNCHFGNFINENGSTVLYGHYYSHITIENSVFIQHNSSKGILFLQNNCSLSFTNSSISQNVASSLGYSAITFRDGVQATMHSSVVENNSAFMGGAFNSQGGCNLKLTNCTFSKNKAITGGSGGAIFLARQVQLILSICTFEENFAEKYGGAVRAVSDVRIEVINNNFTKNKALGSGGAIGAKEQVQLVVTNCLFEGNMAHSKGGAISCWNNTKTEVQNTTFTGNNASSVGGAIRASRQSYLLVIHCTFEDNLAQKWGGAIDGQGSAIIDISRTHFLGNKAEYAGGAIEASFQSELRLSNCRFESNALTLEGHGGGISTHSHSQLRLISCAFKNNLVEGYGGAICAYYSTILDIIDTNFTHNKASISGGALWVENTCEVGITRCLFIANKADVYGGSLHIRGKSSLAIEFTNFMNNSGSEGGAIYVHETELKTKTCTFEENSAIHQGGAIQMDAYSSIIMKNCHFISNKAVDGGAMYLSNPNCSLVSGTTFFKNMASQSGGAAHLSHSMKSVIFENVTCIGNRAEFDGGCLVTESAILIMKGSNVTHNHASHCTGIDIDNSRIQVRALFKKFYSVS